MKLENCEVSQTSFIMGARSVRSVSPEFLGVSLLPGSADRWSELVGFVSSLGHASSLSSGGGESSALSVGMCR